MWYVLVVFFYSPSPLLQISLEQFIYWKDINCMKLRVVMLPTTSE